MNKKQIPIFFAVDDNYVPCLAVALQSLIDNSSKNYYYYIRVLYTNIKWKNQKIIKKMQQENIRIDFVNVSKQINKVKQQLYTRDYFSAATYFRLFIPELYPQYNKVLYLDCDIVVLDDVADLYNIDLEDNLIAAAPDGVINDLEPFREYAEKVVGVSSYKHYFNAGVIVMNLEEMRKFKFMNKFLYSLETIKFRVAQDQDYLNRLCKGRVKIISDVWNRMPLRGDKILRKRLKLIHYNMANKPWHFDDVLYQEFFWKYAEETVFYDKLLKTRDTYPEEKKKKDALVIENLTALAEKETSCVGDDRRKVKRRKIIKRRWKR